jgi:hypothetical protein
MPSRHSSELEVVGPRGPSCPGGSRALYRSSSPRLRTRPDGNSSIWEAAPLASQLASKVRKRFGVACSGAEVHHVSCNDMADMVRQRTEDATASDSDGSV